MVNTNQAVMCAVSNRCDRVKLDAVAARHYETISEGCDCDCGRPMHRVAVCSLQTIGVHTPTPIPVVNHAIYIQPYPVMYPYRRFSVEKECLAAIWMLFSTCSCIYFLDL